MTIPYGRYVAILASFFAVFWVTLAIDPTDRATWVLENALVVVFALVMVASYRAFRFSRFSYTLIFVFLCLHTVGAHYTYAEVPYDRWFESVFNFSLNDAIGFERNHYDRAVHFSYGLLLAYPVREIFIRIANVRGFWGYFLPLDITLSTSAIFELVEWGAAIVFGEGADMAYLGTQGDVWDAHKDMALAGTGALIAMVFTAFVNYRMQRDFATEWADSLRVKRHHPLAEYALWWWRRKWTGRATGPRR